LKGIGSKLASNIVQYRNSLGGFSNKLQLKEVYGVTDETYQLIQSSISVSTKNLKRYSLQEATFYELNAHPYLRGEIAQSIVEYRKAHNYKIDNLNQLKEIPLINEQKFRKIVPYLSL
jgi:DNA uptake protein ComE-like DNA-binding protein